jgi:hypothetical protein
MRRPSHLALMAAVMAASAPLAYEPSREARQIVPRTPHSQERLTKAEKKRARKAAQRAKLAASAARTGAEY